MFVYLNLHKKYSLLIDIINPHLPAQTHICVLREILPNTGNNIFFIKKTAEAI